jgi:hypothetical protein
MTLQIAMVTPDIDGVTLQSAMLRTLMPNCDDQHQCIKMKINSTFLYLCHDGQNLFQIGVRRRQFPLQYIHDKTFVGTFRHFRVFD